MSATGDTKRVITRLHNKQDWKQLLDGHVDAIRLIAFASPEECSQLLTFVVNDSRSTKYATAASITRLGSSFNDVRKTGTVAQEYSKADILEDAIVVNSAISRLFGTIAASWPFGTEAFTYQGFPLHRSIARRIVGGAAEPHDDNIAKELEEDPLARTVQVQLGVNLYLEVPHNGGELEGWHRRLGRKEYDELRNADPKLAYGVRRDALGERDWVIKPTLGEVIIFRNTEIHAICKSNEARTTWGFFLGYRGEKQALLVWS